MVREGKLEDPAVAEIDGGAEMRSRSGRRVKRKYRLRSNSRTDRVLRSRSKAAAKANKVLASGGGGGEDEEVKRRCRRRMRKKNKTGRNGDRKSGNEFLRIRNNLSYMLHKIRYERSLIDAYSREGWKGMRYGRC